MQIDYTVYCYSCNCSTCLGKDVYVGKSKYGTENRHAGHLKRVKAILGGRGTKKDLKIDYFIAKHGIDNCSVRTLVCCSSEDEMNQSEVTLINEHKTSIEFQGMNFDIGGKGGRRKDVYKMSQESKEKLRASIKTYYDNLVLTDEDRKRLSDAAKKRHKNDPTLASRRAKNGWETIRSKIESDEDYKHNFQQIMSEKAHLGGEAFLERLADPQFKKDYSKKMSEAVSSWCRNNPGRVASRAQKINQARLANGKWLDSVRKANARITPEEYLTRAKKGWETRRKNKLNKQLAESNNKNNDKQDNSEDVNS